MGSERLLSRTAGNQWLGVSPLPAAIPCPGPAVAPRACVARRPPSRPPPFRSEAAAWTHLRLPGSGYGRLGASDVWTGQVRGRQEPPPIRGPPRGQGAFWPRAAPCLCPRGIVGGRSRGEEAGGGVGSVRPEGSPSAARSSGPAARAASGCPG